MFKLQFHAFYVGIRPTEHIPTKYASDQTQCGSALLEGGLGNQTRHV